MYANVVEFECPLSGKTKNPDKAVHGEAASRFIFRANKHSPCPVAICICCDVIKRIQKKTGERGAGGEILPGIKGDVKSTRCSRT